MKLFLETDPKCFLQVELPEGPLEMFTHDQEPFLRKQGMPTKLNRGTKAELLTHSFHRFPMVCEAFSLHLK
jgi:hypothetical protein